MSFIPEIEKASTDEQQDFQLRKLRELLHYLDARSPFYQSWNLADAGVKSLSDLEQFPTTSKSDLQADAERFRCVPLSAVAEFTATSGTLGSPVSIPLTQRDIERLAYNEYLSFELMGAGPGDRFQMMLTLDRQFMAGMAYYLGLQRNGATAIRTGPGLPALQFDCIRRLSPTALIAVPSFLLKLIAFAKHEGIDLQSLSIAKALCIGEGIRDLSFGYNTLGEMIRKDWPLELYSTYASTEMQTAFTECQHGRGGHMHPELIITEIVDDEGRQLPEGVLGEVCITTLGVEGLPLLRYRTGDICCYHSATCSCGRNTIRLSPVVGRKQQMVKYKGTTLYPPAVFDVLNQCDFISEFVVEVQTDELGLDELILHLSTPLPVDECDRKIRPFLQARLRVLPSVRYLPLQVIHQMQFPEGSRKAIRFIDNRVQTVGP